MSSYSAARSIQEAPAYSQAGSQQDYSGQQQQGGCDQGQAQSYAEPAQSSAEPAQSFADSAPQQDNRWADYSPQEPRLEQPDLPPPNSSCYRAPQIQKGQNKVLNVNEPPVNKNLNQNFNDVKTVTRDNTTHKQHNRTVVTNVTRNHNHLIKVITNENNYDHFLTNNIVKVQDIHRQKVENVKGQVRNFKDYKTNNKVENGGCKREDGGQQAGPCDNNNNNNNAGQQSYSQAGAQTYRSAR